MAMIMKFEFYVIFMCQKWYSIFDFFLQPFKNIKIGVPFVAKQVKTLTSIHKDAGYIPGLAQWVKDLALPLAVIWSQMQLGSGVTLAVV